MTEWKPVPDFPDYEVSENGDVRRDGKHLRAERVHGNGRKRFALSKCARQYRFKASQLVALAFIGPSPFDGAEVCHNDGFEHNNHYSNLRWDSRAANAADTYKHAVQQRRNANRFVPRQDELRIQANEILSASRRT